MNNMPTQPVNSVEDSVQRGRHGCARVKDLLDAIWSDLTGEGDNCAGAIPTGMPGLVYAADDLASSVSYAVDRLEAIRARIASPKGGVGHAGIAQANAQLGSAKGWCA